MTIAWTRKAATPPLLGLLGLALLAPLFGPGCDGNVNDDTVFTLNVTMVSRSTGGTPGESSSFDPDVSGDGRFVVFSSFSDNLDARDTNGDEDVFIRDTSTGATALVSVASTGASAGNEFSEDPRISPDGRFVAFISRSTNLNAFADTNNSNDVFVRDLSTGITVPVSVNSAETNMANFGVNFDPPDVVSDAVNVHVVFSSSATDVVAGITGGQIYLRRIPIATFATVATGTTVLVSSDSGGAAGGNGFSSQPALGQDAANLWVAWESSTTNHVAGAVDGNGASDVFWRGISKIIFGLTGPTQYVSRIVASVTAGNMASFDPAISADGRFVAFATDATNLSLIGDTNAQTDVYVRGDLTMALPTTSRASLGAGGVQATAACNNPSISMDGQFVAFESASANLVGGDTNGQTDVFVRDRVANSTSRSSLTVFGGQPTSACSSAAISGNGRIVVFDSSAPNLVPGFTTFSTQVYRRAQ